MINSMLNLYRFICYYLIPQFDNFGNISTFTFSQNFDVELKRFLQLNNLEFYKQENTIRVFLGECELMLPINEKGLNEIWITNFMYNNLGLGYLYQGQILQFPLWINYQYYYGYCEPMFSYIPVLIGAIVPTLEKKIPLFQKELMKFFQDLSLITNNFILFPFTLENIYYTPVYDKYMVLGMEFIDYKSNSIDCNLNNLFNNIGSYLYLGNNIESMSDIMILKQGGF